MLSSRSALRFSRFSMAFAALVLVTACGPSVHKKGLEDMRLTPELVDRTQAEGKVDLTGDDGVVCRLEMPTGSHIGVWRCDTYEAADARARRNQHEIQKAQAAPKAKIF